MIVVAGACFIAPSSCTGCGGGREPIKMTLELGMAWSHIKSHHVSCGNEVGDIGLFCGAKLKSVLHRNTAVMRAVKHCLLLFLTWAKFKER